MSTSTDADDPRITYLPAVEIHQQFIEYFEGGADTVDPSASLVTTGDQTLLFTNSGMVQFKDALTGAETRSYTRAVDYQRSLRVAGKHNDFEEVGRTPRHQTQASAACSTSMPTPSARRDTPAFCASLRKGVRPLP